MEPFGPERISIDLSHQTFWLRNAILAAMTEDYEESSQPKDFQPKFSDYEPAKTEAQRIADEILESL